MCDIKTSPYHSGLSSSVLSLESPPSVLIFKQPLRSSIATQEPLRNKRCTEKMQLTMKVLHLFKARSTFQGWGVVAHPFCSLAGSLPVLCHHTPPQPSAACLPAPLHRLRRSPCHSFRSHRVTSSPELWKRQKLLWISDVLQDGSLPEV